jgi:hypothetical protein
MKQKRTTLKKFIKDFPVKPFKEENVTFPDLKTLSYKDLYELSERGGNHYKILSVKEDSIYYAIKSSYIKRTGKRFYKQHQIWGYLYISPTEINIKHGVDIVIQFLQLLGFNWIEAIPNKIRQQYFKYPSIFKSILIRSIYNEETFYRAIARRIYHIDISWRQMRDYLKLEDYRKISLIDLRDFTKNYNRGLTRFLEADNTLKNLLRDLLANAVKLNQIVDFNWSESRIQGEHQKQIRELNKQEITTKSSEPIYEPFDLPDNIHLLNTELDVFMEGYTMHHCLYSNYWRLIKERSFIAFHMTYPEDCTFSIRRNWTGDGIIFDQASCVYNACVKE